MARKNKRNKRSRGRKHNNAKYSRLTSTPSTEGSETKDGACGTSEPKPISSESSSSSSEDLSLETLAMKDNLLSIPKQESPQVRSESISPRRNISQRKQTPHSSTSASPRKESSSTQNLLAVPDHESSSTSEGSGSSTKTFENLFRKVSLKKTSPHSSTNEDSSRNVSSPTRNLLAVPDQESSSASEPSNAPPRKTSEKHSGKDSAKKQSSHSSTNEGSSRNVSSSTEHLTATDRETRAINEPSNSSPRKTFERVLRKLSPKKKSLHSSTKHSSRNVSPSTQNLLAVPDQESSSTSEPSRSSPKKTIGHAFRKLSPKKKSLHSRTPEHSSRNVSPSTRNLLAVPDQESTSTSEPSGFSPKTTLGNVFRKLSLKKKSSSSSDSGCVCVGGNHNPGCPEWGRDKTKPPASPKNKARKSPIRSKTSFSKAAAFPSNFPEADITTKDMGKTSPSLATSPGVARKSLQVSDRAFAEKCDTCKYETGPGRKTDDLKPRILNVEASGSRTVEASGSRTVEASGSRTVEASGSRTVEASGSRTVEAAGSRILNVEAAGSRAVEAAGPGDNTCNECSSVVPANARRVNRGFVCSSCSTRTTRTRTEPQRLPVCHCRSPYNHEVGCSYWLAIRRRRAKRKREKSS